MDEYLEQARNLIQKTGAKVNTVWISFMYPYYSISHPDGAKVLLKSSAPKDESVGGVFTMIRAWIGKIIHVRM